MNVRAGAASLRERIKSIFHYRNMIYSLVKRDLKGRYRNSAFGFLWNFMNPLFQIIIYYIAFSALVFRDMPAYYIFLPCGMIPWHFFSSSVSAGSSCIVSNGGMVKKINFPREVVPITLVTKNLVNFMIAYTIVFLMVIVTDFGFNGMALLFLPVIILIEYVFILGLVFLTSSVDVYYRDISQIMGVLMMGMIWVTPVIYRNYMIESTLLETIIKYNPMTYFMNVIHDIMYFKVIPDMFDLIICMILAVAAIVIGWLTFVKLQRGFAEEL